MSALDFAAQYGSYLAIPLLLICGSNPRLCCREGNTALHSLIACVDDAKILVALLNMLITAGANIHATDTAGRLVLFYACYFSAKLEDPCAVVNLLLDRGCKTDINQKLGNGSELLVELCGPVTLASLCVIKLLLDNGANPHAKDSQGLTPSSV